MIRRTWYRIITWLNGKGKSASVRLTKLTGKSPVRVHPKHLVGESADPPWYMAHVAAGMRVLDLGCGSGVHSLRVAGKAAKVWAMDYDPVNLRTGLALAGGAAGTRVAFLAGDAESSLPFAADAFDLVLLLDVIEHLTGRVSALREIGRVLRPDGLLLLAAPNRDTRWKHRLREAGLPSFTDPDHKVEYTWPDLVAELRQGGFVTDGEPGLIVYDTPWAGLMDVVGGIWLPLYRRLGRWKREMARRYPEETSGWLVVARQEKR